MWIKVKFVRFFFWGGVHAKQPLIHAKEPLIHAKQPLIHALSTVCPRSDFTQKCLQNLFQFTIRDLVVPSSKGH